MSFSPPPGSPFQASQGSAPEGVLAPTGSGQLEYMRAYNYIFENPNWMTNVLWGFLCFISASVIPIVGSLVFIGYQFDVLEALCLSRGTRYPDFSTDRFGDYLARGVWPFLISLIGTFVLMPVAIAFTFGGMFAIAGSGDSGAIVALILIPLLFLFFIAIAVVMNCLLIPMMIRGGLTQDFGQAFNFGWAMEFAKKMWLEMVLSGLFLALTGILLSMLGLLACFVGTNAALAVILLAQAHFYYQLYAIFLSRGGEPIPLKPKMQPPMIMPPTPMPHS